MTIAITSVVERESPYIFYTIKEFMYQNSTIDTPIDWFIFVSNKIPQCISYLDDAIRTFTNKFIKIHKQEIPSDKNYIDIYKSIVEKTIEYDYVVHIDLNYILLPYSISSVSKHCMKEPLDFLKKSTENNFIGTSHDVVYLLKSKTQLIIENPFIENPDLWYAPSIGKHDTTHLTLNNITYNISNQRLFYQPHIRTKRASNILLSLINKSDVFSFFLLKYVIFEEGIVGDIDEWRTELENINYGPFNPETVNYNINSHIPILLVFPNHIHHTVIKHDYIRPIYYCWKQSVSVKTNMTNVNKLISKYNPRAVISCKSPIPELFTLPFEYRKRLITCIDIDTIPNTIIENIISDGMFDTSLDEKNPLISVITCTYESKSRILKPFHTLLNQTYSHWEWIIIDDSVSGDTWKDLQDFAEGDYRIKIYKRPKNDGSIGKNKQFSGNLSSGKYIFELDHDDGLEPRTFEIMLKAIEKHPDADFFYSDCSEIYEDTGNSHHYGDYYGTGFGSLYMSWWEGRYVYTHMMPKINPHSIRHIVGIPNHFRCWTRKSYIELGSHNYNLQVCDDYELIVKTFLKYKFCHVPQLLYIQYRNDGGDNFTLHRNKLIQYYSWMVLQYYNKNINNRFKELGVDDDEYPVQKYTPVDWEIDHFQYKIINYIFNENDTVDNPLITIVLPMIENDISGLEETIKSIFNQSYKNFELIIVGNVCPLLESFMYSCHWKGDTRIKWMNLFKRYDDNGVTLRNYAIKMLLSSKWITYIDQNYTWLSSNHLQIIVDTIKKNDKVDMILLNPSKSHHSTVHTVDLCVKYGLWKKSENFYLLQYIDDINSVNIY